MKHSIHRFAAMPLVLLSLLSCASPQKITEADIDEDGTATFAANCASVWQATRLGLVEVGFSIAVEDEENGQIRTAPKVVQSSAQGNQYSAQLTEVTNAYKIKLSSEPDDSCTVRAEPMAFVNGEKVGLADRPYWRKRWNVLFDAIEENLPSTTDKEDTQTSL